jgi:putative membrane protein
MLYLFLKSFHLIAVLTWVGGMLALSVALRALPRPAAAPTPADQPLLHAIQRWDRRVTTPALGLVWLLGITLAVMGNWEAARWLWLKFAIVAALSGLHGNLSASLRRWLVEQTEPPARTRLAAGFTLAGISAVALLVVLKPWA